MQAAWFQKCVLTWIQLWTPIAVTFKKKACLQVFGIQFSGLLLRLQSPFYWITDSIKHEEIRECKKYVNDIINSIYHRLRLASFAYRQLQSRIYHKSNHELADISKELANFLLCFSNLHHFWFRKKLVVVKIQPTIVTPQFPVDQTIPSDETRLDKITLYRVEEKVEVAWAYI